MAYYQLLYLFKFLSLMIFSGGFVGAFLSRHEKERHFAVHGLASPGLTAIWFTGLLLAKELGYALTSAFIVWGFLLSLLSLSILILAVSKQKHGAAPFALAASPLILVLYLMVARPLKFF